MQIKKKNTWLCGFLVIVGVIGSLLLVCSSCEDKVVVQTIPAGACEEKDEDPFVINDESCTDGFKIELADVRYENFLKIGDFTKKNQTTGAFDVDVEVKLKELIHSNGFVSNHVWLHPDKVSPQAFLDEGNYEWNSVGSSYVWSVKNEKIGNKNPVDGRYCRGELDKAGAKSGAAANANVKDAVTGLGSRINTDTIWAQVRERGTSAISGAGICEDLDVGGAFINEVGKVKGQKQWIVDGIKDDEHKVTDVQVEVNVSETGIYYLRDNTSSVYTVTDGGDGKKNNDNGKTYWENDSDELFDEYSRIFMIGGSVTALPSVVFPVAKNIGIEAAFTKQPKSVVNIPVATGDPMKNVEPTHPHLGSNLEGGWQKLFTIKPCNKSMTNGFTVAYDLGSKFNANLWEEAPTLEYSALATDLDQGKKVVLRQGGEAGTNKSALIFDSVPNEKYLTDDDLGLFTIQHADVLVSLVRKNAIVTKGMLVCRSAIVLESDETTDKFLGAKNEDEATLKAITDKVTGHSDGEIIERNVGLGMTCYLGLTALWPEAVDDAPKLMEIHKKQFENRAKMQAKAYDLSDKHIGIVAVKIDKNTSINDPLLQPIFATPLAGVNTKLTAQDGKAALKAIRDARSAGGNKVDFVHGVMTLRFEK